MNLLVKIGAVVDAGGHFFWGIIFLDLHFFFPFIYLFGCPVLEWKLPIGQAG